MLAGCRGGQLPDPNDPRQGKLSADTINRQMRALNEGLAPRRFRGEITDEQWKELLARGAQELLQDTELDTVSPDEAWLYAEVLRTARQWKEAEPVLRVAVKHAKLTKNEDRRVNDSLRLAQALAEQGKVDEAIKVARSTFDVRPRDAVPVMMGTLYEIIPAARGKGKDVQLARLLQDAIAVHERAEVDPNTESGKLFLMARDRHIRQAWSTVVELYSDAGRPDLANQAMEDLPTVRRV